jgi:thiol-disulfide isomerase/thioredoxin
MRSPRSLLLLVSLLPGLAGSSPAVPAQEKPAARPVPPRFDSLSRGIEEARKRGNTRLFVFVGAKGCDDCDRMTSLILPSRNFKDFVEDKVIVHVDVDSEEGARLGERYGINSAPAWIVMTPEGILSWLHKGTTSQTVWMELLNDSEMRWAHYRKALAEEAARPGDGPLVFENAKETFRRHGDELAEKSFRRLVDDPSTPSPILEQSLAYLATIEMNAKRLDDAQTHLETLLRIGKDPVLKERAELRLVDVAIGKNDPVAARARLDRFVKAHPGSSAATVEGLERLIQSMPVSAAPASEKR